MATSKQTAAKKTTAKTTSAKTTSAKKTSSPFTDEERAAMKEHAQEVKASRNRSSKDQESDVLAKIAEMPDSDRTMAERLHEIIKESAPELTSRLWYGMPAYAKDGKVLCFFQSADKFKNRYATLGFSGEALLDEGSMWPNSYALTELTAADEKKVAALVKQAVG